MSNNNSIDLTQLVYQIGGLKVRESLELLANKFYVDEIYDAIVVKPLELCSQMVDSFVDSKLIGGFVSGISTLLLNISGLNKRIQNGNIEYYLTFMVIALALFLGFNLLF